MAFTDYKCVDDVVKKHKLRMEQAPVVVPALDAPAFGSYFLEELQFSLRRLPVGRSEIGAGEIILFPILREVWKPYAGELSLFSHESFEFDDDLKGVPDYFVCRKSEYGQTIPEVPYLLVMEDKLDDFERTWGQCLAQMLAAQKLNNAPELPIYGITTNSKTWEFGVLKHNDVTLQQEPATLYDLQQLGRALHAVMRACRDLAVAACVPASTP